jgi:hypothetical protein
MRAGGAVLAWAMGADSNAGLGEGAHGRRPML